RRIVRVPRGAFDPKAGGRCGDPRDLCRLAGGGGRRAGPWLRLRLRRRDGVAGRRDHAVRGVAAASPVGRARTAGSPRDPPARPAESAPPAGTSATTSDAIRVGAAWRTGDSSAGQGPPAPRGGETHRGS